MNNNVVAWILVFIVIPHRVISIGSSCCVLQAESGGRQDLPQIARDVGGKTAFYCAQGTWITFATDCQCSEDQDCAGQVTVSKDLQYRCSGDGSLISLDQVNDDYCDCQDGSDEPLTSACSQGTFRCWNLGHEPKTIPSSHVLDGVCDCCDGSDEYGIGCPDSCMAIAEKIRVENEAWNAKVQEGLKKRKVAVAKASSLMKNRDKESLTLMAFKKQIHSELKDKLDRIVTLEERAQRSFETEQLLLWARRKSRKLRLNTSEEETEEQAKTKEEGEETQSSSDDLSTFNFDEIHQTFQDLLNVQMEMPGKDAHNQFSIPLSQYFTVKEEMKEKLDKPITSQSVEERRKRTLLQPFLSGGTEAWIKLGKTCLEAFGVLMSPIRLVYELVLKLIALIPINLGDSVDVSPLVKPAYTTVYVPARMWLAQTGIRSLWYTFWDAGPTLYYYWFHSREFYKNKPIVPSLDRLHKIQKATKTLLRTVDNKISSLKKADNLDLGPDNIFIILKDQCFTKHILSYEWKLCFFDNAFQGTTLLGKFDSWEGTNYDKIKFTKGLKCWNGPTRSVTVHLHCGTEDEIISIEEPSVCVYEMVFQTPLACSENQLR